MSAVNAEKQMRHSGRGLGGGATRLRGVLFVGRFRFVKSVIVVAVTAFAFALAAVSNALPARVDAAPCGLAAPAAPVVTPAPPAPVVGYPAQPASSVTATGCG